MVVLIEDPAEAPAMEGRGGAADYASRGADGPGGRGGLPPRLDARRELTGPGADRRPAAEPRRRDQQRRADARAGRRAGSRAAPGDPALGLERRWPGRIPAAGDR